MRNAKKGIGTSFLVYSILVIIGIVLLAVVWQSLASASVSGTTEALCKFSNSLSATLSLNTLQVSRFCKTQTIIIKPDDWRECNPEFRAEYLEGNRDVKEEALRKCTTQQIAEYAVLCWEMNGQGKWQTSNWVCYNINVEEPDEDEILEREIDEVRTKIELELTDKLCNDDIDYKPGKNCSTLVSDVKDLVYENLVNEVLIDFYRDLITNGTASFPGLVACKYAGGSDISAILGVCSSEEDYWANISKIIRPSSIKNNDCDSSAIQTTIYPWCSKIVKAEETILHNNKEIESLLRSNLENPDDIKFVLYEYYNENGVLNITSNKDNISDNILDEGEVSEEELHEDKKGYAKKEVSIISDTLNLIAPVYGETPPIASISENYFKEFLRENEMLFQEEKYREVLNPNNVHFLDDMKVQQNVLVSIGFCAGKGQAGSGVVPRLKCSLATGPEIQFGMKRSKSPYAVYCDNRALIDNLAGTELERECRETRGFLFGQ